LKQKEGGKKKREKRKGGIGLARAKLWKEGGKKPGTGKRLAVVAQPLTLLRIRSSCFQVKTEGKERGERKKKCGRRKLSRTAEEGGGHGPTARFSYSRFHVVLLKEGEGEGEKKKRKGAAGSWKKKKQMSSSIFIESSPSPRTCFPLASLVRGREVEGERTGTHMDATVLVPFIHSVSQNSQDWGREGGEGEKEKKEKRKNGEACASSKLEVLQLFGDRGSCVFAAH